jgi:polyisoprenoid-binding protein YceI
MRPATLLALFALAANAAPVVAVDRNAANEVPAASSAPVPKGAYAIDKAHTSLIFRVSHLGFSTYTGRFTRVDAELQFSPADIAASRVNVNIDPRSIEADNTPAGFLQSLAGNDWLDADRFPQMKFESRSVEMTGTTSFRIRGELTMHGVTRPIVLDARYNGGYAGHTYEPHARIGFSAQGSFKRSDFGVSYGLPAPGTSFGVGDEVTVLLESEFTGPPL